jgi:hypothetical protein
MSRRGMLAVLSSIDLKQPAEIHWVASRSW